MLDFYFEMNFPKSLWYIPWYVCSLFTVHCSRLVTLYRVKVFGGIDGLVLFQFLWERADLGGVPTAWCLRLLDVDQRRPDAAPSASSASSASRLHHLLGKHGHRQYRAHCAQEVTSAPGHLHLRGRYWRTRLERQTDNRYTTNRIIICPPVALAT